MLISEREFRENLQGYRITDCAVRGPGYLYFVARNEQEAQSAGVLSEHTVTKRVIHYLGAFEFGNRCGHRWYSGRQTMTASGSLHDESRLLAIETDGSVIAIGGGKSIDENAIPKGKDGPRRGAIRRVRMIGDQLHAVGAGHTACRREGPDAWTSLCFNLPLGTRAEHDDERKSEDMAFNDIDGFGPDDLYAVAGRGVVWHCDGRAWRRIPFPSNMRLESVCCAGDGQVYIGAQSGALFRGRGDRWSMIHDTMLTLPFKDIVWHSDRVWCTSDYGLWTVEGDGLAEASVGSDIKVCAGNLSAARGVMLMAGTHGAAFHDGSQWHRIFNHHEMDQAVGGQ